MPFVPVKRGRYVTKACVTCKRRFAVTGALHVVGHQSATCSRLRAHCEYGESRRPENNTEALIRTLQDRVRRLEASIEAQSLSLDTGSPDAEDVGSMDESDVSEDDQVFNRLQLDEETGEHLHYGPPSILMLQGPASPSTCMPSAREIYACDIELSTPADVDWRRHLPSLPQLSRSLHDDLLVLCLRSFSFYNIVDEAFFWRDMIACLSDGSNASARTPHYSPFLHVSVLLCGSQLVKDSIAISQRSRAVCLEAAHKYLLEEGDRPSLSTIKGALMLGQYYTAERQMGLGYMYTGMAMRFSHMLGLSLPRDSTFLSRNEAEDRHHMYWCLQLYDKLWSHHYGHPPTMPLLLGDSSLPEVHDWQDNRVWSVSPGGSGVKSMQSTTLHWTARLLQVGEEILYTIYSVGTKPYSSRTQRAASMLGERLRSWWSKLPDELRSSSHGRPPGHVLTLIGYYHYNTILLFRPYYLRRNASHDPMISQRARAQCNQAGFEISELLVRYDRLWGLRSAPIVWAQIAYAGYTAHLLRMANCDEDADAANDAFINANAVISHLHKLGPPFATSLQFADTMAKALHEWETSTGPTRPDIADDPIGLPGLTTRTS